MKPIHRLSCFFKGIIFRRPKGYIHLLVGLALCAGLLFLLLPTTSAGGWAVITLDELPAQVMVDNPITIAFVVRQHGRTPVAELAPQITATHAETGERFSTTATEEGSVGHYTAELTFPQPGLWQWTINAFAMDQPMPALSVVAGHAAWGRELFVAKGCIVCHHHAELSEVRQGFSDFRVGPDLPSITTLTADPTQLAAWLKNPAAFKANANMPDLELNKAEIEALVAFLTNQTPATAATAGPASANPAGLFFIRAQGAQGPLLAYDMVKQVEQFRLPPGMPAADGSQYFAVLPRLNSTSLEIYGPTTGRLEREFTLPGRWTLGGVSPTGRWLALSHFPAVTASTNIQIVDTTNGEVVHSLNLKGNFAVETISASGDALFLIEYLPANQPAQYRIRLFDLSAEQLQPEPLRAKTASDEVMTGLAWGGVASVDGRWLLTLYLNTARNVAFIHALDLVNKFPFCIDLPSGAGQLEQLKHYALTIAPDGRTVYAANPALGVVAEVNLERSQLTQEVEFSASPMPENMLVSGDETPHNYTVLSPAGQMLYFSSGWDIWGYNTETRAVSGPYLSDTPISGLGLSADGRQLYVATAAEPLAIDLETAETLSLSRN